MKNFIITLRSKTRTSTGDPLISWMFFLGFAGQAVRNTVDWLGYGILVGASVAAILIIHRQVVKTSLIRPPVFLAAYAILAALSIIWSNYRLESLLGVSILLVTALTGWVIVSAISWETILLSLYSAMKWIVTLSFMFEFYIAAVLKHSLLPLPYIGKLSPGFPPSYYWSYGELFTGGPIQGIVGNRNLLGFIALLLIALAATLALAGVTKIWSSVAWVAAGLFVQVLTNSATITADIFAVFLLGIIIFVMRQIKPRFKRYAYLLLSVGAGLFILGVSVSSSTFFALLDRSPDMTNRFFIWEKVAHLALERPEGWGWIGYWAPWVEPFKNYVIVDNTVQLHAHNALIDIWLQLGVTGVLIASAVAILGLIQAWKIAVNTQIGSLSLAPLLLLTSLLVQSVAESRLLIEGNWLLFVILIMFVNKNVRTGKEVLEIDPKSFVQGVNFYRKVR